MSTLFAYGAGYSSHFEPINFITKPQVILRFISIIFAIIVFGCISAGSYDPSGVCIFAMGDISACSFGIATGVIAFIACLAFLASDAIFDSLSNINYRKYIVITDMAFSGFWAFIWFVDFCYLTNKWAWTSDSILDQHQIPTWQRNNCRAAIAFSFFSIISWVLLCFFAVRHYLSGGSDVFTSGPQPDQRGQMPEPSFSYPGVDPTAVDYAGSGSRSEYYAAPFSGATPGGVGDKSNSEFQEPRY